MRCSSRALCSFSTWVEGRNCLTNAARLSFQASRRLACKAVGYVVFNASKLEQAKALFLWAHGDGLNKPSLQDVDTRVLELMDPKKAAEKQAEKAAKKDQPKPADAD